MSESSTRCLAIEALAVVVALAAIAASALGRLEPMLVFCASLVLAPVLLCVAVAVIASARSRGGKRPFPAVAACVAICISVAATQWPLRIAFADARPDLARLAADAAAGKEFHGPQRAGIYTVHRVELRANRVPYVIVNVRGDSDGFAPCDAQRAYDSCNGWSTVALEDEWTYVFED